MSTIDDLPSGWKVLHNPQVTERITLGVGIECAMTWYGPWEDRHDFLDVVAGSDESFSYPGGVTVTRRVPLKYPDERYDDVYAYDCEMRGEGRSGVSAEGRGITYALAFVTVYFRSQQFYVGAGDYPMISLMANGGADMVTVPGTAYEFPSDSLRVDHNAGVLVPTVDFAMTFHNLPSLDDRVSVWEGLTGRVNSDSFYTPFRPVTPYDPGYVQMLSFSTASSISFGNVQTHTATLQLRYRRIKHNEIMRPDGTGFEAPERVGSSDYLLPTAVLMGIYI